MKIKYQGKEVELCENKVDALATNQHLVGPRASGRTRRDYRHP